MSSQRTAGFRAERLAIEKEIAEAEQRRRYVADTPARIAAEQKAEHERRALKKRLLLDPIESHDFVYKPYDGRFASADEVTAAIKASWDAFLANHDLDQQAQTTLTEFLKNHPNADISLPETFEAALSYLEGRLNPPAESLPVPTAEPITEQDQYLAELRQAAESLPVHSRERSIADRALLIAETKAELLLKSDVAEVLQMIVAQTGKALSADHSLRFLDWLQHPAQRRRYRRDATSIRLAFAEYFGTTEHLSDDEQKTIQTYRAMETLSSADIKQAVGSRTTYDPFDAGFRASRAAEGE
jgi:hypothetical protein